MPRNMSFALTTDAVLARQKTVTRRRGWQHLRKGELFWAVKKAMGLRPGEKIQRLALLRCVSNEPVCLAAIDQEEVRREGFADASPGDFVAMFCQHMRCASSDDVQRIEFEYVEEDAQGIWETLRC